MTAAAPVNAPWAGWPAALVVAVALAVAGSIAALARRAGSLSPSGALAATATGAVAILTSWRWGAFLVLWFVMASLLSRAGRAVKQARTAEVVEKGDRRDAGQVFANGGVFALAAVVALVWPGHAATAALAAAASLTAAGADTAATEVGTRWGGTPWSLRTRHPAVPGTSGALSAAGTLGMLGAAGVLGALAAALQLVPWTQATAVATAGVAGALMDTVLGAWAQARRWCPACQRHTEQPTHRCGTVTEAAGGIGWLTNDRVNALCALTGAAVAVGWWWRAAAPAT